MASASVPFGRLADIIKWMKKLDAKDTLMKTDETLKMKTDETAFLAALVVLELILLPALPLGKYGGGIAMMAVGLIGLPAYFVLFKERLRSRGQFKTMAIIVAVSFAVAALAAAVFSRIHWH
jgi:hypothetical protein